MKIEDLKRMESILTYHRQYALDRLRDGSLSFSEYEQTRSRIDSVRDQIIARFNREHRRDRSMGDKILSHLFREGK